MRRLRSIPALLLLVGCGGKAHPDGGVGDGGSPFQVRSCNTRFSYHPDTHITNAAVAGEWNGFDPAKGAMTGPDASGNFTLDVPLPVGAFGYKLVIGVTASAMWILDPSTPYTKYVGGVENSLVEVGDCNLPALRFVALTKTPTGTLHAEVTYVDGAHRMGLDPARTAVTLDGKLASQLDPATGRLTVDATGIPLGKHRLIASAGDRAGNAAEDLHIPFWIEPQDFDFRDGVLYFAFTDRFRDGDPSNNAPIPDTDPRANYDGGDFAGITQSIDAGYFDGLGVRTLWVSPPNKNPDHWELGSDNRHYSGYHGYWPDDGRKIQPRFGDVKAMKTMVEHAHAHGIRVIVDTVLNHVHNQHPYFLDHKNDGWFNGDGSCTCGGPNCDWDTHRLDCWFTNYLPDLNYQTFPAVQAMIDDALYWARDLDVDGFRVDAVKHFYDIATVRLRSKLHDQFEWTGPLYYLVGETFTGGDDGGRMLIQHYIGPHELNAQFDFPLYWNILGSLCTYGQSMRNLEEATAATDTFFGDAPMSPFLGNHDVPRFISTAAPGNTPAGLWNDNKAQAWMSPPTPPVDTTPYDRLRLALTFLLTQPGVPLLYYGDEIGIPGAGDPDNRRMMRFTNLAPVEQATLDFAKKIGQARKELSAIRRGKRYTMWIDDDVYVYARALGSDVAVIAINRASSQRAYAVPVRTEAPIPDGTLLKDRLGGASVTVAGGKVQVVLGARTSAILAP